MVVFALSFKTIPYTSITTTIKFEKNAIKKMVARLVEGIVCNLRIKIYKCGSVEVKINFLLYRKESIK